MGHTNSMANCANGKELANREKSDKVREHLAFMTGIWMPDEWRDNDENKQGKRHEGDRTPNWRIACASPRQMVCRL